ncbi:head maturation protease, ClpP-related [Mesorhizobium sp. M0959]|uniref:head maturation protease, ClpP-related n=1 Tax=unclassified Mesorhizobium TaxID=325217 RepID=UPI0033398063
MADIYTNGELILHGPVAGDFFGPNAFTSHDVIGALAQHGSKPLTVRLNCPGGDAFDGIGIYNALARHKAGVTVVVEGLAASAGSLIAMAGSEIVMCAGTMMMLHEAHGVTVGPASAQLKQAELLDRLSGEYASIYAARAGAAPDAVRASMKDEIWFTAEEAVEAGYATKVDKAKAKSFAAFDYRAYAKAPEALKALALKNNWTAGEKPLSASAEKDRADTLQAELDALKASSQTEKDRQTQASAYEASRLAAARVPMSGLAQPGNRGSRSGPTTWNDFLPK